MKATQGTITPLDRVGKTIAVKIGDGTASISKLTRRTASTQVLTLLQARKKHERRLFRKV